MLLRWITCIGSPTAIAARRVCVPITSPQWITASAPSSFARSTACASGSAGSWLSETMQTFMLGDRHVRVALVLQRDQADDDVALDAGAVDDVACGDGGALHGNAADDDAPAHACEAAQQLVRRREVGSVGLVALGAAQAAGAELRGAGVQQEHEIDPIAATQEFLARVDDEREPVAEATGVAGGEVPDRAGGPPYFLKADAGWPRISPSGAFTPISFIAFAIGSGVVAFRGISRDSFPVIEGRNAEPSIIAPS